MTWQKLILGVNSDTLAFKLVNRGLVNVLLCCLLFFGFISHRGSMLECVGNSDAQFLQEQFVKSFCWSTGLYLYANQTSLLQDSEYSPVYPYSFPGLPWKSNHQTGSIVDLTWMGKIPLILIFSLLSTHVGFFLWNYFRGNFLTDLIWDLGNPTTVSGENRKEHRELQLREITETFKLHLRFYTNLIWYYIGCMICTTGILVLQFLFLFKTIGNKDLVFALKVLYFSFTGREHNEWPVDLVESSPTKAFCDVPTFGHKEGYVDYTFADYMCILPWSQTYLVMFACIYLVHLICIVGLFCSVEHYILFALSHNCRERELRKILKLDPKSNAYKGLKYISPGSAFMLVLLSKNVDHGYVCFILENVYDEFKRCPDLRAKYEDGTIETRR